jgi:hypothetical protein
MARVCFLTIALTALLPACTAQEPQTSVAGWKAMVETRNASQSPASATPEKDGTSDCLRKGSLIEAWSCASQN